MSTQRPLQVALAVFDKAAASLLASHLRRLGCTCTLAESISAFEKNLRSAKPDYLPDLIIVELGKHAVPLDKVAAYATTATVIALAAPDPELFFQIAKCGIEAVFPLPLDPLEYSRKLQQICRRLQALTGEAGRALPRAQSLADSRSESKPDPNKPVATAAGHAFPSTDPASRFATSEEMAEVREMIKKVAPTSAAVLIRGESGVGKELAARLIHSHSLRAGCAFIKVNCAAIPHDLLESELFGFEAGAFTGAVKAKPGKFEMADGGTIFLDEIGEMHLTLQAKLLHVLQDGDFARLGSNRDIAADVRVICATNRQLDLLVARGEFREDLYYRVNVITISLPPLRARKREIPELLEYFVGRYAQIYDKPVAPFAAEAVALLLDYDWPGNIRELENLCKRYVIVGSATQIMREMVARRASRAAVNLGDRTSPPSPTAYGIVAELSSASREALPSTHSGLSLLEIGRRAAWAAERAALEAMLQETHWNRREAARRLQISYKALLNKIQILESESESLEMASR